MQQSVVKFYCFVVQTLLNLFLALLCPSSGARQTAVATSGFLLGLLMMGIVKPEACWAVSVRQSNKILRLIVASSWVFYLSDRVLSHVVMKIWRLPSFSIVHMKCCQPNAIPFTVGLVTWPLWVGCPSFYSSLGNWNRRKITFLCTGYV